jgi:hypothetical protein
MNLRQVWTEIFQKSAVRLLLFLIIGGIFLAFILLRRGPQPKPDNTQVAHQATRAQSYSFDENIPPPPRGQSTPAERTYDKAARATPTPKPPPPIPQTIFVTKEQKHVLRARSGRRDLLPLHHADGGFRQSHGGTFRIARTLKQPQTAMKFLHSILLLSLVAGCATKKEVRSVQRVKVPSTSLAANNLPKVRTPETVKAYPLGRYTDPNFPEEMHERHTLYRREQSAEWNYRPSKPYALPLGPVIAQSNPSPSNYARTDSEQINAQQKAYAEALLEQNQVLKKRIDALQQKDSTIQNLQGEIERLKKELESRPSQQSAPPNGETPNPSSAKPDDFSKVNTLDFTDPSEIMLFPRSEADYQAFLISQMRLNDELSAELCALERRRFEVLFGPSSPSRSYLALTTHKNP